MDTTEKEKVAKHIRLAFELLKQKDTRCRHGEIELEKRAVICASMYSELADFTEICGLNVMLCNLQSGYDYFLCINNPTKAELEFLNCHREAMELDT